MRLLYTSLFILFLCTGGRAQYTISGTIVDKNDQVTLIAASVHVKGTTTGTVTDIDGYFVLNMPQGDSVLVVSYTGYQTLEYKLKPSEVKIRLEMDSGATQLSEVVVVGYGVQKREQVTGSVISVSSSSVSGKQRRKKSRRPEPTNRTSYNKITPNAFLTVADEPISTLSTDVDRAAYSNIRGFLNRRQLPPVDAVRIEEMINYFSYARPAFPPRDPVHLNSEMITCPWNPEAKLLRVTAETPVPDPKSQPANNLVFLLDVSGSMGSPGKLPLVKESLRMLAQKLTATDRVSIVVYAGAAGQVLPPTPGNDTTAIFGALDRLQSGGSTAGGAGIQLAYQTARAGFIEDGNNRVIIATDGDFNVGIRSQSALIKMIETERKSGVFLTVLGFGQGNYQEGTMQELADRGNGNHAFIDSPAEARKVLVEEFGGTIRTVAKDVKLQLVFDPEYIDSYRLIGYENRLLNTEDFDDDTKDAAEMGAGHQVTVLYEIIPAKNYAAGHYIATLKMRFKPAKGGRSHKIQVPIAADRLPDELATQDILWAAAVAEFGMLLRGSEHKGQAGWTQLRELAAANLGADPGGYRKEMLALIGTAESLSKK